MCHESEKWFCQFRFQYIKFSSLEIFKLKSYLAQTFAFNFFLKHQVIKQKL